MPAENPAQNPAQSVHAESGFDSQPATVSHEQTPVLPEFASPREIVRMCSVGDTGLEHAMESSGGNGRGTQSAAESAALDAREAPLGSDLRAVVSAWPNLPDAIRAGILAMISATK